MLPRSWHDFIQFDDDGNVIAHRHSNWEINFDAEHAEGQIPSPVESHVNVGTLTGSLSDEDGGDMVAVVLNAGQTYTFSYRGTVDGVVDPYLRLVASDGTTIITQDDDGGYGRSSQITFTPTTTGTYYLNATSWYQVDPTAPDYQDNGAYTIAIWSPEAGHDAGSSLATAGTINVGTNYEYFEVTFDQDVYGISLTAGQVYTFSFSGGVSSGADWDDEPGESIGVLALFDSSGNQVIGNTVNYESSITFVATDTDTYYLRVIPYSSFGGVPGPEMTGGYTIDVTERPFSDYDPLESLNWDSASNIPTVDVDGVATAYVYFAAAGEDVGTGETTYGWEQHQIDAVMHALNTQYSQITNINYVVTTDIDEATFRMITVQNNTYGARFYPQAPEYGALAGVGSFNLLSGGFGSDPNSLLPGGYSYEVILHEFGHAHGIAHPHDTGGGSEVMLGVTAAQNSFGLFDLNQGVYTVMSYNSGWSFHPDGDRNYSALNRTSGWNETLGAFDIAVLQARYGVHDHNTGNTVYTIADTQPEASYQTIWDTGGNDTIAYVGTRDAHIDLLAATLDYSPTGGGVISFAHGVWGGYTIANGVVIENATGGSGNDVLLGNSANNVLTGNAGDDVLLGRDGDDRLYGNGGDDDLNGEGGSDKVDGGAGDDVLNGGAGNDQLFGGAGNDVFVFTEGGTDQIMDYESGELIDLSALGVTVDDITITRQFILVDLDGQPDLRIMFDTRGFSTDNIILGADDLAATSDSFGSFAAGGQGTSGDYMFA